MTAQVSAGTARHFYVNPGILFRRLLLVVGILTIVPIVLSLGEEGFDAFVFVAYGVLIAVVVVVFLWVGSRTRLTTSPQGMEFRGLGFVVTSTWDNIERIGEQ